MAKSLFYKPITRFYWNEENNQWKQGRFIASGDFADGHLAYTMLDENGNDVKGEETSWYQVVYGGKRVMFRI